MQLRHFVVTHGKIGNFQVNQADLYLDAKAAEDENIFDESLPSAQDDASDVETEEEMADINTWIEAPTFSEVYVPEIVARRTTINCDILPGKHRQTLIRSQHPPMEKGGNQDEWEPYTAVTQSDPNHAKDNPAASHTHIGHPTGPRL